MIPFTDESCFSVAFKRLSWVLRTLHWIRCSGCWSLWRQISNNGRIVLYIIQGSLTGLRCRDEIVCPLIQRALQAMGPGATLCRISDNSATPHRARVITYFLLPALQIWLLSIFGQRVAKNYLTPVDVYQLTRVLQQVWQSKLFRSSSSPQVRAA